MQLFEMQGLLAGKCLPGDIKVNESLAEYLLRQLNERDDLRTKNSALQLSQDNIINALGIAGEGAHSKLVIECVMGLVAENARMREAIEFATAPDMWQEQHDGMLDYRYVDWYVDVLNAALEPKSTGAAISELRAQGVALAISHLNKKFTNLGVPITSLEWLEVELRAGRKG